MSRIVIRCDASQMIGSGHVIRCRALARELRRHGAKIVFICRKQEGDLNEQLKQEFDVIELNERKNSACNNLEKEEKYTHWLGCDQITDAQDCLKELKVSKVEKVAWVIVDHYSIDETWETLVINELSRNTNTKLLAIDDLADRNHEADLLLDQNYFGKLTNGRYKSLTPGRCKKLLGPSYAILGKEYANLHHLMPRRNHIQRILIYFGAVDSKNMTSKAIKALMDPVLSSLSVDIVIGRNSNHKKQVETLAKERKLTTVHEPMSSLAGLAA